MSGCPALPMARAVLNSAYIPHSVHSLLSVHPLPSLHSPPLLPHPHLSPAPTLAPVPAPRPQALAVCERHRNVVRHVEREKEDVQMREGQYVVGAIGAAERSGATERPRCETTATKARLRRWGHRLGTPTTRSAEYRTRYTVAAMNLKVGVLLVYGFCLFARLSLSGSRVTATTARDPPRRPATWDCP